MRPAPFPDGRFVLQRGDVVAFLGGADIAATLETGHLEALLAMKFKGLGIRFRNFGWEGDTVFAHPRDVGYPAWPEQLRSAGASVIMLQYGRAESLDPALDWTRFDSAYARILDQCLGLTPRVVLVTPPPFEKAGLLLPDLTMRNAALATCAERIRDLARRRGLPVVDLFTELGGRAAAPRLTDNGLQLTPFGQAVVALGFARRAGFGDSADRAGAADPSGAWSQPEFERVRQAVLAKNRLWLNYWRPENWAFLGGDRTEQPSSRDHLNPKIRWFPQEIQEYRPLIERADAEIEAAASKALP